MSSNALPTQTRRARRRAETRSRIADAAERLFQRKGYAASTVAELCEEADVAYKTFFNHFPSKLDVLLEIEARSLQAVLDHFAAVLALEAATRDRILEFFRRIAQEADEAGPAHRELLAQMIHSADAGGDEPDQVGQVVRAIEALIAAGVDQGDVRTDYPIETIGELVRGAYYALINGFANLDPYPVVERASALAGLVADAVCVPRESDA